MNAIVIIPKGKVALGKLAQAIMYGAEIVEIDGNFDDALKMVKKISENYPVTLVNSTNPYRLEGQKTAAFEIIDQLGGVAPRSEEHTSELQSRGHLVCRLLLQK